MRHLCVLLLILGLAACQAAPPAPPAVASLANDDLDHRQYKAVLIAADARIGVFDRATSAFAALLAKSGRSANVQQLTASPFLHDRSGFATSTLANSLSAVSHLSPGPGEACLVFVTGHGAPGRGLYLPSSNEFLTPRDLDSALATGCGNAPTIAIISSCFSGIFASGTMLRGNRIILVAVRPDRTSFGCGADQDYTVFDRCLLRSIDSSENWPNAARATFACVANEERRRNFNPPSEPFAFIGQAIQSMPVLVPQAASK